MQSRSRPRAPESTSDREGLADHFELSVVDRGPALNSDVVTRIRVYTSTRISWVLLRKVQR